MNGRGTRDYFRDAAPDGVKDNPEEQAAAARYVRNRLAGADDLDGILDMLGLTEVER